MPRIYCVRVNDGVGKRADGEGKCRPEETPLPDERLACARCGSVDIAVDERPVPGQPSGAWPYVDRAVLSCRRCHHHWIRVDVVLPQVTAGQHAGQ